MSQQNVLLAQDAVAAFNRRDVAGLVELTTDDFEWVTWTGTVEPTAYHGAEGLAAYFRDSDIWHVLNLEVREYRDHGDEVLVAGTFHARGGGSGAEIHAPYYSVFFTDGGKLARVLSFRTEDEALQAVGLREQAISRENVELVLEGYARWQAGDYDLLLDFFLTNAAPDVELYSRLGGFSGTPYRGHDGLRAWLAEIQENFARFEPWVDEAREAGHDRVVATGGISFRARESGVDMAERLGWVYEFRQGRLRRMMFYGSPREALEAVGLRE